MRRYVTVPVVVKATRMSREDYCRFREWELPANENGEDEGWLIDRGDRDWTWVTDEVFQRGYEAL